MGCRFTQCSYFLSTKGGATCIVFQRGPLHLCSSRNSAFLREEIQIQLKISQKKIDSSSFLIAISIQK